MALVRRAAAELMPRISTCGLSRGAATIFGAAAEATASSSGRAGRSLAHLPHSPYSHTFPYGTLLLQRGASAASSGRAGLLAAAMTASRGKSTQVAASSAAAAAPSGGWLNRARAVLGDYKQLSKLRLSLLVVSTAAGGYVLGSGEEIDWAGLAWTSLGTLGCAASANTLNQVYEIKLDALMKRTMNRPLPSGRVSRPHALAFALVTGVGGVWLLTEKANSLTAGLGLANIALYAAVYTPLKTVSIVNTWMGAVVGAVPPLMGWAAAAGDLSPGAYALGAVLYWWQMPHFMALAWMCKADYTAGGYRMLSMIDSTGRRTAACALRNCVYLMPLGILAVVLGVTSDAFAFENALISGGMAATAGAFYQSPSLLSARVLFRASLLHLPLLMTAMMAHRVPNEHFTMAQLEDRLRQRFAAKEVPDSTANKHGHGELLPIPAPFPFLALPMTATSAPPASQQQEGNMRARA